MNLLLRRLIFAAVGVLLVVYGLYKVLALWAHRGWAMPGNLRDSVIGFTQGVSDWQRVMLYLLLAVLPIIYLELWRRGRRIDRLIRVSEGLLVQESAITGFLRGAIGGLSEVQSITARAKMNKGRGLALSCGVEVESRLQIAVLQSGSTRSASASASRAASRPRVRHRMRASSAMAVASSGACPMSWKWVIDRRAISSARSTSPSCR